jgi:hypothetical protein
MVTSQARFEVLSRCMPLSGVREPLDRVTVDELDQVVYVTLIDANGQGRPAADAVARAHGVVSRTLRTGVAETFVQVHRALEGRSGVSLGILRIRRAPRQMDFFGLGRVYGVVAGQADETLVSEPGTLGLGLPKVPSPITMAYQPGDLVALASDGLIDTWELAALWRNRDAELVALVNQAAGPQGRLPEDGSIVLVRLA